MSKKLALVLTLFVLGFTACSVAPEIVGVSDEVVTRAVTSYTETFANCTATGTAYVNGNFKGVAGWTWYYVGTAWAGGDISGKTPVLGKGRNPAASVYTTVNNGIGTVKFKVKKPYSANVNLTLKANGATIATITHSSASVATVGPFTVNKAGSVKLEIVQTSTAAGQASIDDINWTSYEAGFQEDMSLPLAVRNYYRAAYGLSGAALKTKLQQIVTSGHVDKGYAYLWTLYRTSDVTPYGKIWDLYSNTANNTTGVSAMYWYTPGTSQCGNYSVEGDCYNREHMIPQSYFAQKAPMVSDAHHVTAVDAKVNGMRSNYPHADVASATWTSKNKGKLGPGTAAQGYTGVCFEPRADAKGDIARIYFYFSLRYNNNANCKAWASMNAGAKLKPWAETLYKSWAVADPVSQKEKTRNDAIYAVQKNRNPFIDYPVLINMIDFKN